MVPIQLRPGDTLHIVCVGTLNTPLGAKETESSYAFTYDDLLARLRKIRKPRPCSSNGIRFSRVVALSTGAIRTGKWSNGVDMDRSEVFVKLLDRFNKLAEGDYADITAKARASLAELYGSEGRLTPPQKRALKSVIDKIK